ncbi:hypothetical protein N1031_16470 [Herbiconiux moechotypicola]|uniref:Uncharacterized protein n=1 Tax=Herbiconiux moechotypicola TaxID=637393 RepID=A0ABP5R270_9MICO|nr:hypothetical protein [Herbiconiux moechotypicola]MCS5731360.1 hypothetical protein [Herbiconiux moechotypicola]
MCTWGILYGSTELAGAAIDSQDTSVISPAEELALQGRAGAVAAINLIGTALGITALVIGIRTRKTSTFSARTIIAALLAPLLCFLPSIWLLSAASTPE